MMIRWRKALTAIGAASRELTFLVGMAFLAYGASMVFRPALFLVPGALLTWSALPTRQFPIVFRAEKETH